MNQRLLNQAKAAKEFFDRSTRCLEEQHSGHAPADGMFTVAQQVAHVGQTIDWFIDGVTTPEGFDMDFAAHDRHTRAVTSLTDARAIYETAFQRLFDFIESSSEDYLNETMTGPVLNGAPRQAMVDGVVEHTAHHRGALSVYSRTLGLTPLMPYMEPQSA